MDNWYIDDVAAHKGAVRWEERIPSIARPHARTEQGTLSARKHRPLGIELPDTENVMCRNIKTLANYEPPATEAEIRASALQFVRKLSGATRPSKANEIAFQRAVDEVAEAATRLIASLTTTAPPRDRETEALRARERSLKRFPQA